jgi:hypothetical protein
VLAPRRQVPSSAPAPTKKAKKWEDVLPIELRLMIWDQLANNPRDVAVTEARNHPGISTKIQSRLPEIMQICRESRKHGKKFYRLVQEKFGSEDLVDWDLPVREYDYDELRPNLVWINPKLDRFVVVAKNENMRTFDDFEEFNFSRSVFSQMQNLVVEIPGRMCVDLLFTVLCQQKKLLTRRNLTVTRTTTSGEDVHPCNSLLVLFVDILAVDCEFQNTGEQRTNNSDQVYALRPRWRRRTKDFLYVVRRPNRYDGNVASLANNFKVRRGAQGSRLGPET